MPYIDTLTRQRALTLYYYTQTKQGHTRLPIGKACELLDCSPSKLPQVIQEISYLLNKKCNIEVNKNTVTVSMNESDKKYTDDCNAIFEYWLTKMGKDKARVKLTPDRRKKIRARLDEGYSAQSILLAIDGILLSDFHVQGGYLDITHVCKNARNVDKFIELTTQRKSLRDKIRG